MQLLLYIWNKGAKRDCQTGIESLTFPVPVKSFNRSRTDKELQPYTNSALTPSHFHGFANL